MGTNIKYIKFETHLKQNLGVFFFIFYYIGFLKFILKRFGSDLVCLDLSDLGNYGPVTPRYYTEMVRLMPDLFRCVY